jgi:Protein of unknown function (DUF3383).
MAILDLSDILQISVNVPVVVASGTNFSLGLIISQNAVIPASERVRTYSSVAELITDGFAANSPEVDAATRYFVQSPTPAQVAVGLQAESATLTVTTQTSGSKVLIVTSTAGLTAGRGVTGTGIPADTTIASIDSATQLTLSAAATADASSGTVTAAAETAVQALIACRGANALLVCLYVIGALDADIEALAGIAEATQNVALFYDTSENVVLTGAAGNVALTLKSESYKHTLGRYSSTAHGGAALMSRCLHHQTTQTGLHPQWRPRCLLKTMPLLSLNLFKHSIDDCHMIPLVV